MYRLKEFKGLMHFDLAQMTCVNETMILYMRIFKICLKMSASVQCLNLAGKASLIEQLKVLGFSCYCLLIYDLLFIRIFWNLFLFCGCVAVTESLTMGGRLIVCFIVNGII